MPLHIRVNRKYIILASIWYGLTKPDMNILLKPVLSKLHELHTNGTTIIVRDSIEEVKIMCHLFILKVSLGSDKNVPYIGFTSPTRFNKKFSELNYNYKHYFTISG